MADVVAVPFRATDVEGSLSLTNIVGGPGAGANTDVFIQAAQSASRRVSNATDKGFWLTTPGPNRAGGVGVHVGLWVWVTHYGVITNLKARLGSSQTNYDEHNVPIASYPALGGWYRVWIEVDRTPDTVGGSGLVQNSLDEFALTMTIPGVGGTTDNLILDAIDYTARGLGLTGTSGVWNDFVSFDSTDANRMGVISDVESVLFAQARLEFAPAQVGHFSVVDEETLPRTVTFKPDGTKMFVVGTSSDIVYSYSLSSAWDITTATKDTEEKSVSAEDNSPQGLTFKPDGLQMFICGSENATVYSYTLSSAWDVSSATKDAEEKLVSAEATDPESVQFEDDGTAMFVLDAATDTIYQYGLSAAWDVSSATKETPELDVNSEEAEPSGFTFKPDGSKLFVSGANQTVYQYSLSTDWDLSTASKDTSEALLTSDHASNVNSVAFKSDGTKMFALGTSQDIVFQYNLATAWDVAVISSSLVFNDSDFVVVFPDQSLVASTFMGILIHLENAATNIDWADGVVKSAGTKQGDLVVVGTSGAFDATDMTLANLRTIDLTSACTLLNTVLTNCDKLNQLGATLDNCTVSGATTADGEAFIIATDLGTIKNSNFNFSDGHAVEITATGTYTFDGNTFTGYGLDDTNDAAIYNNSGGLVTINVTGGVASPTVRNGTSASTVVNNNVSLTFSGMRDNTEVRVYTAGTTTELAGVENATDGSPDDRSVTFSLAASTSVDVRFAHGIAADGNHYLVPDRNAILALTWPTTTTTIPITQVLDRNFDNPA